MTRVCHAIDHTADVVVSSLCLCIIMITHTILFSNTHIHICQCTCITNRSVYIPSPCVPPSPSPLHPVSHLSPLFPYLCLSPLLSLSLLSPSPLLPPLPPPPRRYGGRRCTNYSNLCSAQVQHWGDLWVPLKEDPHSSPRLHLSAEAHRYSILWRQQAGVRGWWSKRRCGRR